MTSIERLQALAREWGGDIKRVPPPPTGRMALFVDGGHSHCPFDDLAVHFERREVWHWEAAPNVGSLIHEAGHVFASRIAPEHSEEYDFFGWEAVVARRAGVFDEWLESSGNYQIQTLDPGGQEFGRLDRTYQRRLLADRIRVAKRAGLIRFGRPVSIRSRKKAP